MTIANVPARRLPHPVELSIPYPERLSRGLIFVKWLLVLPHAIIVYAMQLAVLVLTIVAWFAILFTGRYPRGFFNFTTGVLRWSANVFAYFGLMRDEYPPFSTEAGQYPLGLEIPLADRQSRFRLFIRGFAIIPNQLVFWFVQIAWFFVTFIAWWAILITGRYPRGLFKFNTGVIRWYARQQSYLYCFRDEYPPYSINADARPGNEWLSAIVGVPMMAGWLALQLLPFAGLLSDEKDTVKVRTAIEANASGLGSERPTGESNNVRITLTGYDDDAFAPPDVTRRTGYRFVSFDVEAEKDGFWPALFTPVFLRLHDCAGGAYSPATMTDGFEFRLWWRDGDADGRVWFQIPRLTSVCTLVYHSGVGEVEFVFP